MPNAGSCQALMSTQTRGYFKCKVLFNKEIAVRLFSNRSQMTSKCGKNKKVARKAIAECVTDVLITF